jgi:hypothetical protein
MKMSGTFDFLQGFWTELADTPHQEIGNVGQVPRIARAYRHHCVRKFDRRPSEGDQYLGKSSPRMCSLIGRSIQGGLSDLESIGIRFGRREVGQHDESGYA